MKQNYYLTDDNGTVAVCTKRDNWRFHIYIYKYEDNYIGGPGAYDCVLEFRNGCISFDNVGICFVLTTGLDCIVEVYEGIAINNQSVLNLMNLVKDSDIEMQWKIMCALETYIANAIRILTELGTVVTLD